MNISYNWLKWYIPDVPEPEKLREVLDNHLCEVESVKESEGDHVFDLGVLPDRAHYLLSHQGVAREISSLLAIPYVDPAPDYFVPEANSGDFKVDVKSNLCNRFMTRVVRNAKVGPSPKWMVDHLAAIGQRSINNMVDAANIVMYDCGQPIHVYDLDKLKGGLIVRDAVEGEELTTLDDRDLTLKPFNLVISDNEKVLGLAGVKGGKPAEVDDNTKNIVIEIGNFDAVSVRRSARRLGIFTDAAKRFENSVPSHLCEFAMTEMSALIHENSPESEKPTFEQIQDYYPKKSSQKTLSFNVAKVSKILGLDLSEEEVLNILSRYDMQPKSKGSEIEITIPMMRLDINTVQDVAEEIGRVIGYDKIEPVLPKIQTTDSLAGDYAKIALTRKYLISQGFSEVITYTFTNKGQISVLESASDKNYLRTNLADGLTESLKMNKLNAPLLDVEEVKVFEIGNVFTKEGEAIHVAWNEKKQIKEVSLDQFLESVDYDEKTFSARPVSSDKFSMWSVFPFITRDVAVWVPSSVDAVVLENLIKENINDLVVKGPELFDTFSKEGRTSYAFRLVFQSIDRTLTDVEVNEVMDKVYAEIGKNSDWELR